MVSKMSEVLSVLGDGRWHMVKEVQDKAGLDGSQIRQVMEFLERYCFVDLDKSAGKVMLKENCQKFFRSEI